MDTTMHELKEKLARIDERTIHIEATLDRLQADINNKYVSKNEFAPVKSIVYGLVALILTSVAAAVVALVL